jgi:hypothetical protein
MTTSVISQPRFFPGLHYLHRMMTTDIFVILDTVQYTPRHEENRTRLKSPQGSQWLTIPMHRSSRKQPIMETYVNYSEPWQRKAIKTIANLYSKAPYYDSYASEVNMILEQPYKTLTELDRATWEPARRLLGIDCRFELASELAVSGQGPQLLLNICQHLGADTYLSGAFGQDYIDAEEFAAVGVKVKYFEYNYPTYSQRFDGFVPYLSYLDMLFNVGLDYDRVLAGGSLQATQTAS